MTTNTTNQAYGASTVQMIKELYSNGINRFSVIMRHSARHYDDTMKLEAFMGLTEEGKDLSFRVGKDLPDGFNLRLFSSNIGRCIETAYLIDKGYTAKGGKTQTNNLCEDISPFYFTDFKKAIEVMLQYPGTEFIRNWIGGKISTDILLDARETTNRMLSHMTKSLGESKENTIIMSISHDWNMYLLKEMTLDLAHETYGLVEYLEGLIIYYKDDKLFITNHQVEPRPLNL